MIQDNGSTKNLVLYDVKYVPQLKPCNLFSLTRAIDKGFNLGNEGRAVTLSKGDFTLKFPKQVRTKTGYVSGLNMYAIVEKDIKIPKLKSGREVNINTYHQMLGHISEERTRATAKYYNVKLTGKFETCYNCALAKARQNNLGHVKDEKHSNKPGETLSFDIINQNYKLWRF